MENLLNQMPPPRNLSQVIQLLTTAIQVAQKRGCYTLRESAIIYNGISFLEKQTEKQPENNNIPKSNPPKIQFDEKL
jgi:hypothetical protein